MIHQEAVTKFHDQRVNLLRLPANLVASSANCFVGFLVGYRRVELRAKLHRDLELVLYLDLFSALGGTRIPNLLIRSQKCLNGVLTGGFAGQG